MNWFELDYKLTDNYTINHSNDGYTRDRNLIDVLVVMRDKIKELESNQMTQIVNANTLQITLAEENKILKDLLFKIMSKDYPEMILENTAYFTKQ